MHDNEPVLPLPLRDGHLPLLPAGCQGAPCRLALRLSDSPPRGPRHLHQRPSPPFESPAFTAGSQQPASAAAAAFCLFALQVFGKRASLMQSVYVCASTLSLAVPLLVCLPLLRHGWVLIVGLLDLAVTAADVFAWVKPGFLLWALLDAFVLKAALQEALKFAVCFQLSRKQKVRRLNNLLFYAVVAAITFSFLMTTNDSVRLAFHPGLASGGAQEMQRRGAFWNFAIFHGAFELPIQIITAFLIACTIASTSKEEGGSFLQVIQGPILLHGVPAFCTQLARHLSQNVAAKLLWGRQVEAIPQEALRAVTATTALCHFASTIVMLGSLTIGLIASRQAEPDRSANASLLEKEADDQA
ncbi:hypothetical protein Efla_003418 [Eimeria flavescens]